MALVNLFEIETSSGYKSVELYSGDLTKIEERVDSIVVSAFKGGYTPIPGTLVGSLLENCKIHLELFAKEPEIDLRIPLNVWISKPIPNQNFNRIICIEIIDLIFDQREIEKSIKNLFSLIALADSQDIKIESIALPFIGTGNQGIAPERILPTLMELSKRSLKNLSSLKKIVFYEIDEVKLRILNDELNNYLNRSKFETSSYSLENFQLTIKEDLLGYLIRLKSDSVTSFPGHQETVTDLIDKIRQDHIRPFEIGVLSRRLVEFIVKDVLEVKNFTKDLASSINDLKSKNIASWVISYFHILRTFGNVAAHSTEVNNYNPPAMNEKDLITLFICLNRSLDFWLWYRNYRNSHFVVNI